MESLQVLLSVSVPTVAVLVGILINHSRLGDLRAHMDVRFSEVDQRFVEVDRRFGEVEKHFRSLEKLFDEKLLRVEQVIDARLTRIEKDLEEMRH
jgi:hypothetical protein